jgi:pimeloyl-ACP methyl ester carboxylesterase
VTGGERGVFDRGVALHLGRVAAQPVVLLLLTGGLGQPGVRFVGWLSKRLAAALGAYQLVMIDQRGTGAAALNCPALQQKLDLIRERTMAGLTAARAWATRAAGPRR